MIGLGAIIFLSILLAAIIFMACYGIRRWTGDKDDMDFDTQDWVLLGISIAIGILIFILWNQGKVHHEQWKRTNMINYLTTPLQDLTSLLSDNPSYTSMRSGYY